MPNNLDHLARLAPTTEATAARALELTCKGGKVSLDYRPVHDFTLTDEIDYIKPKARVY